MRTGSDGLYFGPHDPRPSGLQNVIVKQVHPRKSRVDFRLPDLHAEIISQLGYAQRALTWTL
jgi:hypothetical protein